MENDEPENTETFAQYTRRLAREARLRKEESMRQEQERKAKLIENRKAKILADRKARKNRKEMFHPDLPELSEAVQARADEIAIEIEMRKKARICICCGDGQDIKTNGYCHECWNEINLGIINPDCGPSERQQKSAMCRVVRKGSEMS